MGVDLDDWQRQALLAASSGRANGVQLRQVVKLSVRSAHRVGKTFWLAGIHWWWLAARGEDAKVMVTAASAPQLFDALVPEIKKLYTFLPVPIQSLFTMNADGVSLTASPDRVFSSFRTSKPENPESAAGIHGQHICYLCDESSGIHDAVFEAQIGSFADPDVLYILAGNPVRTAGLFFESHNRLREDWITFKVSAFDTKRVGATLIEEARRRWGEDSNEYRVRVLGEFPKADADAVIPFEWLELSRDREVKPFAVKPIWGLDVARTGKDDCALCIRVGNTVTEPVETWRGYDLMETSARILEKWNKTLPSQRPSEINVDAIGLGAGVADRLFHSGLPVRAINVSESASLSERHFNLRAELWMRGREWFEARDCVVKDDDLLKELGETQFDKPSGNGQITIKSKDEMAKLGFKSPNRADAFLLTLASDAIQLGPGQTDRSWNTPIRRQLALC